MRIVKWEKPKNISFKILHKNWIADLTAIIITKTDEICFILKPFSQFSDEEDFKEAFSDSLEKVEKNKMDFIKVETLESFESF